MKKTFLNISVKIPVEGRLTLTLFARKKKLLSCGCISIQRR